MNNTALISWLKKTFPPKNHIPSSSETLQEYYLYVGKSLLAQDIIEKLTRADDPYDLELEEAD